MGRLIDVDVLRERFEELGWFEPDELDTDIKLDCILKQAPTAYDLESVIEKLQTELSLADKEKERCARKNPLQFDTAKGYAHGISVALEIVKSRISSTDENNGG